MAANNLPHFHNNPKASRVRIGAKKFMRISDLPPFDHPHIFIDMRERNEIACPYCSALYAYDRRLTGKCEPAECAFHSEEFREPVPPNHDICTVTASPSPDHSRGGRK